MLITFFRPEIYTFLVVCTSSRSTARKAVTTSSETIKMASLELMYQCTVCFLAGPTMEALLHHECPGLGLIGKYLVNLFRGSYSLNIIPAIFLLTRFSRHLLSSDATYRGLRPNGTTFYQSEIPLLLPPIFPCFFFSYMESALYLGIVV